MNLISNFIKTYKTDATIGLEYYFNSNKKRLIPSFLDPTKLINEKKLLVKKFHRRLENA